MAITKKNVVLKDGPDTALYPQPCVATTSYIGGISGAQGNGYSIGNTGILSFDFVWTHGQIALDYGQMGYTEQEKFNCNETVIVGDYYLVTATQSVVDQGGHKHMLCITMMINKFNKMNTFSNMNEVLNFLDGEAFEMQDPERRYQLIAIPQMLEAEGDENGYFYGGTECDFVSSYDITSNSEGNGQIQEICSANYHEC